MSKSCGFLLFLGIIKKCTPPAENAHPYDLSLKSIKVKSEKALIRPILGQLRAFNR